MGLTLIKDMFVYENGLGKDFCFDVIFFMIFDVKNRCKNDFQDNNENHAADQKIGSPKNEF